MEQNELTKSNKIKIIVLTALVFLVAIAGLSYAYFTIQITGNDTASSMRLTTANLSLVYNDVQIVSGNNVIPGWTQTKTLTVTNNGNVAADYIIKFRELQNTIINGELVMSATCAASTGSCDALPERAIHSASSQITDAYMYGPISIPVGVTHTYTVTVTFKETGSNQNYNQNKSFVGTLNIGDGTATNASLFDYTIDNNQVTITSYKTKNVTVTDQTACQNTGAYMLQQSPYNMDSGTATAAAQVLCSGGSVEGTTIENQVLNGSITSEYYDALGLSVTSTNAPTDVIIPSTIEGKPVTSIGEYAFNGRNLTSVVIPNSVTSIGNWAFSDNQLTSIVIPNSVTSIGNYAFSDNPLTSVIIPNTVTYLGWWVFAYNQLISATISNNIAYIDEGVFCNNQLTSVIIPNNITAIVYSAFYGNQLTSVTIPNSVTSISESAFTYNQLTSMVIPSSVTSIDNNAFYNNQLTSVIIEGKDDSSDFTTYGSNIWGWASGYSDSDIVWTGSGS